MEDSLIAKAKGKLLRAYVIIRVAAEKLPHSVVDDMSDKFSIVLAFVSSIVLSFVFAGAVNFVKQYRIYLSCNNIYENDNWTYDEAAEKVISNSINIMSFTTAYFLAWIAFKLLRPVHFLKICLIVCLGLYGTCSLINSLFFSREIIVAMSVDVEPNDPINIKPSSDECVLGRNSRSMTNINFTAIMCLLYITSIPAAYRLSRMAKAVALNEPLDSEVIFIEDTSKSFKSKSLQQHPVEPHPAVNNSSGVNNMIDPGTYPAWEGKPVNEA